MRFVQIVDPSIYDSSPSGIKINCFTKHHVEWLPTAEAGDVLVLRSVKVLLISSVTLDQLSFLWSVQILRYLDSLVGTGYHDKLQWVACSPPGRIHHGPPNNAPQEVVIGPGNSFSPFYQPTKEEILYCVKLSDWWRGVQKEEQNHRVHTSYSTPQQRFGSSGIKRVHRLISEAGPNVPPNGYFDCTVEVSDCNRYGITILSPIRSFKAALRITVVPTCCSLQIILAMNRLANLANFLHSLIKCCRSRCGMLPLK